MLLIFILFKKIDIPLLNHFLKMLPSKPIEIIKFLFSILYQHKRDTIQTLHLYK